MPERRVAPPVAAFLGALLGALIACMAKGAQLGWDGGQAGWSWLSALFGMLGGPMLLLLDGLTVFGKAAPGSTLVALPWAGIGAAIGAIAGLLSYKEQ